MDTIKGLLADSEVHDYVLMFLAVLVTGAIVTGFILHRAMRDEDGPQ